MAPRRAAGCTEPPSAKGGCVWLHVLVDDSVSVRELRNTVSAVLRRVEAGERVTVTVDRRPVAELVPLRRRGAVPVDEARRLASRHATDSRLRRDVRVALPDTTDDV
ncbi:MAG: type II toxin-antitoxin system Phd/YefM family antitoxin [Solirubrobacteraceae bacterium]